MGSRYEVNHIKCKLKTLSLLEYTRCISMSLKSICIEYIKYAKFIQSSKITFLLNLMLFYYKASKRKSLIWVPGKHLKIASRSLDLVQILILDLPNQQVPTIQKVKGSIPNSKKGGLFSALLFIKSKSCLKNDKNEHVKGLEFRYTDLIWILS